MDDMLKICRGCLEGEGQNLSRLGYRFVGNDAINECGAGGDIIINSRAECYVGWDLGRPLGKEMNDEGSYGWR